MNQTSHGTLTESFLSTLDVSQVPLNGSSRFDAVVRAPSGGCYEQALVLLRQERTELANRIKALDSMFQILEGANKKSREEGRKLPPCLLFHFARRMACLALTMNVPFSHQLLARRRTVPYPITITFARKVGVTMTEFGEDDEPNSLYRYYM